MNTNEAVNKLEKEIHNYILRHSMIPNSIYVSRAFYDLLSPAIENSEKLQRITRIPFFVDLKQETIIIFK